MLTLLVFGIELALGMVIGFFIADNKPGLSFDDVKTSSLAFLVANAFVMLTTPDLSVTIFALMSISWIVVNLGILAGELIRIGLFRYIIHMIVKKDVQLSISEFVRLTTRYGFTGSPVDLSKSLIHLTTVKESIQQIAKKGSRFASNKDVLRINRLGELCQQYYDVAGVVSREKDMQRKEKILSDWGQLGNTLTELSWDALNHAEVGIKERIQKVWSKSNTEARV
jgi:hypothetical protein